MVFSDTTNLSGIIQDIEKKTDLGSTYFSGDSTRLKEITATINNVGHRVWHTIFMSTGNWEYDDNNYTDLPQAVANLVSGQSNYSLPEDALTVQRLEIKDNSDLWVQLTPITKELIEQGLDEFMKDNGTPKFYRLIDGVIELFPATNYNSTNGLKVYFDRELFDFTTSDTTKKPGFASPYHEIIPIGATIEWLKIKQPNSPTLVQLQADYLKFEKNIKEFYGKRFKSYVPKIGRRKESWR